MCDNVQLCNAERGAVSDVNELTKIAAILNTSTEPFKIGTLVRFKLANSRWIVEGEFGHVLGFGIVLKYLEKGKVLIGQDCLDSFKLRAVDTFCLERCMPDMESHWYHQYAFKNLRTSISELEEILAYTPFVKKMLSPQLTQIARPDGPYIVFPRISSIVCSTFGLSPSLCMVGELIPRYPVGSFKLSWCDLTVQ